jgi:hypothetical protein
LDLNPSSLKKSTGVDFLREEGRGMRDDPALRWKDEGRRQKAEGRRQKGL